jgi:hypothetical protein
MDHHETAAADVTGARIGHGHREPGRDRGVHRIAATPQYVSADLRRDPFLRHHHAVFSDDGVNGVGGRRRVKGAPLLCAHRQAGYENQQDC